MEAQTDAHGVIELTHNWTDVSESAPLCLPTVDQRSAEGRCVYAEGHGWNKVETQVDFWS